MKGRYSYTQIVHTGPEGSVPVEVKHDYEGAVPMTRTARASRYLRQNGVAIPAVSDLDSYKDGALFTVRQRRQQRRAGWRAIARAARSYGPQARSYAAKTS